jgi:hypothetical protein
MASDFPDSCAEEGAQPPAPYSISPTRVRRIQAVSEADPWLWRLAPLAVALGAIWCAWEVVGRPLPW